MDANQLYEILKEHGVKEVIIEAETLEVAGQDSNGTFHLILTNADFSTGGL